MSRLAQITKLVNNKIGGKIMICRSVGAGNVFTLGGSVITY
jgi:hypothetical protein